MIITAIGCLVVLTIMAHICIYQGIAQRCSQFIVYAIRKKYHSQYENGETTVQDRIFPDNYKPFGTRIIWRIFKDYNFCYDNNYSNGILCLIL